MEPVNISKRSEPEVDCGVETQGIRRAVILDSKEQVVSIDSDKLEACKEKLGSCSCEDAEFAGQLKQYVEFHINGAEHQVCYEGNLTDEAPDCSSTRAPHLMGCVEYMGSDSSVGSKIAEAREILNGTNCLTDADRQAYLERLKPLTRQANADFAKFKADFEAHLGELAASAASVSNGEVDPSELVRASGPMLWDAQKLVPQLDPRRVKEELLPLLIKFEPYLSRDISQRDFFLKNPVMVDQSETDEAGNVVGTTKVEDEAASDKRLQDHNLTEDQTKERAILYSLIANASRQ